VGHLREIVAETGSSPLGDRLQVGVLLWFETPAYLDDA
jgi:hypothetical protein